MEVEMNFGEKIKNYRMENDYTQDEFAKLIGVSKRTLLLYEQGKRFPKQKEVYEKIAELMNCDYNFLMGEEDLFLEEVSNRYGTGEVAKVRALADGVSSMFAGGTLPEEDIESAFKAITQAYWKAKDMNKKFGKRKNDKGE